MRQVLVLLLVIVTLGAAKSGGKGYEGWALGGGVSLVVPKAGAGIWFVNQNLGPGLEFKGVARIGLGKGGKIDIMPNLTFWGRWDTWGNEAQKNYVSLYDWELNINITDFRYLPPVPDDFAIKPYVGFGLLSFSIYQYKEEIGENYSWDGYYWAPGEDYNWWWNEYGRHGSYFERSTNFKVSQTFMVGADFELKGKFWPYVEFKLTNGDVSDFAMTAGFTIYTKK